MKAKIFAVGAAALLALLVLNTPISVAQQDVEPQTGFFQGALGAKLFYRSWKASQSKAAIVLVHGFGEHSGRYQEMAEHFLDQGLSVYALDHRGHGRSEGPRWNPESFDYYVEDLKTFVESVKQEERVDKVFMLGHSLGGEIALKYAILYPKDLEGLIVSGPAVGGYQAIPILGRVEVSLSMERILSPLLSLMARFLPDMGMPGTMIDPSYLNHDPENYNAYANDPMVCHEPMKLRFQSEALKAILFLQDNAQELKVPSLIMCGSEDVLVPPGSVKLFYENARLEDGKFIIYEGFYHEIFNEVGKERVYADVDAWLLPRL